MKRSSSKLGSNEHVRSKHVTVCIGICVLIGHVQLLWGNGQKSQGVLALRVELGKKLPRRGGQSWFSVTLGMEEKLMPGKTRGLQHHEYIGMFGAESSSLRVTPHSNAWGMRMRALPL